MTANERGFDDVNQAHHAYALGLLAARAEQQLFPELPQELGWAFVRGLLDGGGSIRSPKRKKLRVRLPLTPPPA